MPLDLASLIPLDKFETCKAERLVALGYPAVEPVLPELLEWTQDGNWPVARIFLPFLASIGMPMEPHLRSVFQTDDNQWKYFLLVNIVDESRELARALVQDLRRFVESPTNGEVAEGLNTIANELLGKYCGDAEA